MARTLIRITQGITRHPDYRMAQPVDFALTAGEPLAICGPNGGGKSLLVDILTGAHPLLGDAIKYDFGGRNGNRAADNVRLVSFRDVYGGNEPAYYQQRWNQADEQVFPTVHEMLQQAWKTWHPDESEVNFDINSNPVIAHLGVDEHANKPINQLSSGELRRMQLARMLMSAPTVLIIDNPYIGLDKDARAMLTQVLAELAKNLTLVLVVSRSEDIPPFIEQIVCVENKVVSAPMSVATYVEKEQATLPKRAERIKLPKDADLRHEVPQEVIDFNRISIRYSERTILRKLSWHVRSGEHWALVGENGAGKSTLLSLVCADNPQAYACDIRLFGCQRGKGESIWDIKRRIGYVSPEIYSTYRKSLPAIDIVASGLRDTVGLYCHPSDEERAVCMEWMRVFRAEHLAQQNYMKLSSGQQRLVLLVRAFVKSPDLLILDEPFHGLDNATRLHAQHVIDRYMQNPTKTLIMVSHYREEFPRCINCFQMLLKQKNKEY